MLFNSFQFLAFVTIVFTIYWGILRSRNARLIFLLLASYVFYMSWNPKLIILLLGSTTVDFFTVRAMGRTDDQRIRRLLLWGSILFNLTILAVFKYANFFIDNTNWISSHLGSGAILPAMKIALPLGISFYTFETISYTIDGYYRQSTACKSLRDYALFISFFPHLISGPIVRPAQFVPQFDKDKNLARENISEGLFLILYGLIKKLLIADRLAVCADAVFGNPHSFGAAGLWLGALAYAGQIYCDFSGYSLIALGLARIFDFRLPVNFRTPYLSRNISEFWRRWHITLATWLRDYLYASVRRVWTSEFGGWGGLA
ncbi:MAG: MBOAT family O-acyltransferase, partial [Elusimicrobiota bacterium]